MAEPSPPPKRLLVVGVNHRTGSLALRDRLFVEDAMMADFIERLRAAGIDEAVVLSTCDRIEVQAACSERETGTEAIAAALAAHADADEKELAGALYVHWDRDAVRHLFSVTASLDSQVVGEPQVFGQVKAGYQLARDAGMTSAFLEPLFQAAFAAGKRVRTETGIGERPVSIAAAAVELARDLHGDLGRCGGLVIGAGEMGELIARDLVAGGLHALTAIHPLESRARSVARTLDCHVGDFAEMSRLMVEADIVIAALGRRDYAVTADMVTAALRQRRRKPVFLVDSAVPGDVEPAVNRLDGAFLYDLGDLERVALEGRANREAESRKAWEIVDAEVAAYLHGRAERAAIPALSRLRGHFEDLRLQALQDAGGDAERATRLLINRLLHGPSRAMRAIAARATPAGGDSGGLEDAERTLNRLFGLDEDGGDAVAGDIVPPPDPGNEKG